LLCLFIARLSHLDRAASFHLQKPSDSLSTPLGETAPLPGGGPSRPQARPAKIWIPGELAAIQSLAISDPGGALDRLENLFANPDGAGWRELAAWFSASPADAAAWTEGLPAGPLREAMLERALGQFAASDPSAAMELARSFLSLETRDNAVTSVARRWAEAAPVEALQSIAAHDDLRNSPILGRAFVAAVSAQPRKIGELLALLPAGSLDPSFLSAAAEAAFARQPGVLTEWLGAIQDPAQRSAIAEVVAQHAGRHQPELAFAWAAQISDPESRAAALRSHLHRAANIDAVAVASLFKSPWLSEPDRNSLQAWYEQSEFARPQIE
jgi:hypothetical protein